MAKLTALPKFAQELLAECPRGGDGVHNWLFRAARALHPFFPDKRELALLLDKTVAGCGREVPEQEIEDAIRNSAAVAWKPGQKMPFLPARKSCPKWPEYDEPLAKRIWEDVSCREFPEETQLFDRLALELKSPVGWPDLGTAGAILRLLHATRDPLLCAGWDKGSHIATGLLSEWECGVKMRRPPRFKQKLMFLGDMQFVVPNAMSRDEGVAKHGGASIRCRDNAAKQRRFLVVEFDKPGSEPMQPAIVWHLRDLAPLAMCLFSGGKSLHAWYYVEPQPEEWQMKFFRYAVTLGADRQMWWPEQFARMPNGVRRDGDGFPLRKQTVLYLDPYCIDDRDPYLPLNLAFFDPACVDTSSDEPEVTCG